MTRGGLATALACALVSACASGGTVDMVPADPAGPAPPGGAAAAAEGGSYAHVAKRTMGVVALANAAGLDAEEATRAVEKLADAMDACATKLAAQGKLVDGAIRVTAQVKSDGSITASHFTVAPGDAVAANALLCVVAPLRMMNLSPAPEGATGARSFAVDASWGPAAAAK